jgi:hypothetical protein
LSSLKRSGELGEDIAGESRESKGVMPAEDLMVTRRRDGAKSREFSRRGAEDAERRSD